MKPTLNPVLRPFWLARYVDPIGNIAPDANQGVPIRNRVLYGGRASSKSWDAAGFALFLASNYRVKFLCTRHFQIRLADSVYTLLRIRAAEFGLTNEFIFTDSNIKHRKTGSEFLFYGRARHLNEIKSVEDVDVHWGEECDQLTEEQWQIIEPTIRKEGSQNWLIFNPQYKSDFVYRRFVTNPPPGTLVRRINHDENQFLSETMKRVIQAAKDEDLDRYMHIYQGVPLENNEASIIKSAWIEAAVDAHIKLGLSVRGMRSAALDVADEGDDLNALTIGHGILVEDVDAWSGKGADIYATTEKTINRCTDLGIGKFAYDSDGMGVGVRGDARVINEQRIVKVEAVPFRGSAAVLDPKKPVEGLRIDLKRDAAERTNEDTFKNFKAQAWWHLALKFHRTYRAVEHGEKFDESELIALDSRMKNLNALKLELEQPQAIRNGAGLIVVDKAPDDTKSPNMADSLMIWAAPVSTRNSLFG